MIPNAFDYQRAGSLDEALGLVGTPGTKVIAGGMSLLPLMKLRLASPERLVDIGRIPELKGVRRLPDGRTEIGALTTYGELLDSPVSAYGLFRDALPDIGDVQVRNRGTVGGSIAHADPASDLPAVLLALDGSVTARGPDGERSIPAAELFQDYLTTALGHDEVITEVRLPALDGYGFGYRKFTRRAEDWAMVGVCALVSRAPDGTCDDVRIGLTNMGSTPLRAGAAEDALRGAALNDTSIRAAAD
jgi:aerobic carbon-monoxide dehydrogenase medium subunit